MTTALKIRRPPKAMDDVLLKAIADADAFVRANRERKDAEKAYSAAKDGLLEWLGERESRGLPDGRTVRKVVEDVPAATIDRRGYFKTTVYVGAPPPAA